MKKCLLILLCFFALTQVANAQETKDDTNFWFGPKIGVDLFKPTIDEASIKSQIKSNFQAGFFLQFGRKFYVQPEFYYATQKEEYVSGATTTEVKVDRLKVPVMLSARLVNLKVVSAHIMAGPQLTYLLKESVTSAANPRPKTTYALMGGAGVDLIGLITLDVRYSVDLNDDTRNAIKQLDWDSGVNVTLGIKLR